MAESIKNDDIKEEKHSFTGFILLNSRIIDLELLKKDLKADWDITINEDNIKNENDTIVAEINGMMIAINLVKTPVPNDEAVKNAKNNFTWPEAVEIAENHKAHLIVAVLKRNQKPIDAATLYVKLCASCLNQPNATGLFSSGTVYNPDMYKDLAKSYIENGDLPILNLIYLGLYSNDQGKTTSAYTYGMRIFGKYDIEIIDSKHNSEELFNFLHNILDYILINNAELKDGETIGFSAEQKLPIILSQSDILSGETIKIGF